jgi:hypothetical protein
VSQADFAICGGGRKLALSCRFVSQLVSVATPHFWSSYGYVRDQNERRGTDRSREVPAGGSHALGEAPSVTLLARTIASAHLAGSRPY